MSDYVVVEPGLGRVLPGPAGKRTTITTWAARLQITREDKPDD